MVFSQGWKGFVGVGTQTVDLGTLVAPTVFQDLSEPSLSLREIKPNKGVVPAIRGGIVPHNISVKRGNISLEGGFSGPLYPDDLFNGYIFGMLLGNNQLAAGDATNGFLHTFEEAGVEADYPLFGSTIQANIGQDGNIKLRDFLGCFLNKLTITVPEDDVITSEVEFVGRSETLQGTPGSPSYSTINPFESWMAKLKIGDVGLTSLVDLQFTDLTFEYTTNVIMVMQKLTCTRFPVGRVFGIPEVLMNFNVKAEDDVVLQQIFKDDTEKSLELTLKHDALSGSAPGSEYEIIIQLPKVTFLDAVDNLDSTEDINLPVQAQAFKDPVTGFTTKITSKNSVTGVYAV